MTKPLVFYHAHCADGFTSAWITRRALGDIQYRYLQYGDEIPSTHEIAGRDVYMLDFSLDRKTLVEWSQVAKSLLVLDHHKTAQEVLKDLPFAKFTENEAACIGTWNHFYSGQPIPPIVEYVNDRDLWLWRLPHSHEVNAYIASFAYRFDCWDQIDKELRESFSMVVRSGEALLRQEEQLVAKVARNAEEIEIDGHRVLQANTSVLQSEVANVLARGRPFGVVWFQKNGSKIYSLRSISPKGIDVSQIARKFGGGGHRHAAGYKVLS